MCFETKDKTCCSVSARDVVELLQAAVKPDWRKGGNTFSYRVGMHQSSRIKNILKLELRCA